MYVTTNYFFPILCLRLLPKWIPSLGLKKTKKEKLTLFVQDLFPISRALWIDDSLPLPGLMRVQISVLILLCAATGTRPGTLVESADNKGSQEVLQFKDVEIMKVRSVKDPNESTIVAHVNLVHVKNKERNGTQYVV